MLTFSFIIVALDGFRGEWGLKYFRFVILLSYIIPLSLRVNIDIAKVYYAINLSFDKKIPETVPRNSNIPEELGRI